MLDRGREGGRLDAAFPKSRVVNDSTRSQAATRAQPPKKMTAVKPARVSLPLAMTRLPIATSVRLVTRTKRFIGTPHAWPRSCALRLTRAALTGFDCRRI